jgi:thiamine biosynthesis lipoprotein
MNFCLAPRRSAGRAAAVLIFAVLAGISGCAKAEAARTEYVLHTVCTVNAFDDGTAALYDETFARLREIEARMSASDPASDVSAVNAAAGVAAVKVHDDVLFVVKAALRYAELSGGAFDPTIGPVVDLWGIGGDAPRVPAPDELAAALALVDWRGVTLDEAAKTIKLARPGMRLDLGAIAKGYAADEVARLLRQRKVDRAVIDLGGNIMVIGAKADGSPWRIGVQDPAGLRGSHIAILEMVDKTLVTSGVYERNFTQDGKLYHHILSTADGYPVGNGLVSVTIVADKSTDADGLSTSVFALGYEKGLALVESLPGVEAIFVDGNNRIRVSSGLRGKLRIVDDRFLLIEDPAPAN